jgi:hypothetical protein
MESFSSQILHRCCRRVLSGEGGIGELVNHKAAYWKVHMIGEGAETFRDPCDRVDNETKATSK